MKKKGPDIFNILLKTLFLIYAALTLVLIIASILKQDLSIFVLAVLPPVVVLAFSKKPTKETLLYWLWLDSISKKKD